MDDGLWLWWPLGGQAGHWHWFWWLPGHCSEFWFFLISHTSTATFCEPCTPELTLPFAHSRLCKNDLNFAIAIAIQVSCVPHHDWHDMLSPISPRALIGDSYICPSWSCAYLFTIGGGQAVGVDSQQSSQLRTLTLTLMNDDWQTDWPTCQISYIQNKKTIDRRCMFAISFQYIPVKSKSKLSLVITSSDSDIKWCSMPCHAIIDLAPCARTGDPYVAVYAYADACICPSHWTKCFTLGGQAVWT